MIFKADDGFLIGEADYEQAESRDTAYCSGDEELIKAVDDPRDFHSVNCSAVFGVPYESIIDEKGNILDKELRDLSKRVNHGIDNNMQAEGLLRTMGIENVFRARKLLNLPKNYSVEDVCQYLMDLFDKKYPVVRGASYKKIQYDIITTKMMVGATGWTRYCFANPTKSKRAMNMYAAHLPQSLNAMTLNKAWLRIFYEIALAEPVDFKLCAQIHDSILFQYRVGRDDLIWRVYKCMLFDIPVVDTFGTSRILRVPVGMKAGGRTWEAIKTVKQAVQATQAVQAKQPI